MDEILVKKTLSGDKAAFNQLVTKYQTQVYGLAFNISRNFSDAEDLAQEAFLRAYLSLHQLREPAKFGNWLYRITQNLCRRWLQKKMTHEEMAEHIKMNEMNRRVPMPDELTEARELQESVRNAIDELPKPERLVVTLYYMDGLTQRDIADFAGISESTVKRRLRSSRHKLKGELLTMVQEDLQKHDLTSEFTDKVVFKIESLEEAIRDTLKKPKGPIVEEDLEKLMSFVVRKQDISELTDIEYCVNLRLLQFGSNKIIDVSSLSRLTEIEVLELVDNKISNISPLSRLTKLRWLELCSNQISDINPLSGLTELETLHLAVNKISDIGPLSRLTKLRTLELWENQISDIRLISGLTRLEVLRLNHNQIVDISPLSGLTELKVLNLAGNKINDISVLARLNKLEILGLAWNHQISDISALANLIDMKTLYLDDNQITDISPLAEMTKIGEGNSYWKKGEIKVHLSLFKNQISDISPLVNNKGIDDGDGIDLRGNPLNDEAYEVHIPALQERGVKVLFDKRP